MHGDDGVQPKVALLCKGECATPTAFSDAPAGGNVRDLGPQQSSINHSRV